MLLRRVKAYGGPISSSHVVDDADLRKLYALDLTGTANEMSRMMATTQRGWARLLERGSDALHSTATAAKAVVARLATAGTEAAPREKACTREAKPPPLAAENEQAQRMTRWIEVRAWAAVSVLLEGADGCHARTAAQGQRTAAAGGEIVDLIDHPRDLGVTYTAVLQSLHVTTLALLQAMAQQDEIGFPSD